ncbi:hypothetical protein ACFV0R_10425 [Streptomyces sp. NPDC059578]|uniref:hypothetical protein n=1 Tax=Streptomyces sp. NPDC059578 TaxID=3346874 RepID=UPI003678DFB4
MSRRPVLRGRAAQLAGLLPAGPSRAARTPFVLLMVLLLGGGLITLLMLNSSLNEGSFRLSELKRETTELTDEEQALQRDVDAYSKPGALLRRARELGMVPGGNPAFLEPDGRVRGVPGEPAPTALSAPGTLPAASGTPSPGPSTPAAPAASSSTASASAAPTGTATSTPSATAAPSAPSASAAPPSLPASSPSPEPTTSGR